MPVKVQRLKHKGSSVVLELETDVPRYQALEDIVLAVVDYLLSLGRVDDVLMLLIALSLRCKHADTRKSKFTPEQRESALKRIDQLLDNTKGGDERVETHRSNSC